MKTRITSTFFAAFSAAAFAQQPPQPSPSATTPSGLLEDRAVVQNPAIDPAAPVPGLPAVVPAPAAGAPPLPLNGPVAPSGAQITPPPAPAGPPVVRQEEAGLWVKDMPLNDLMAVMAKRGQLQYFSNPSLDGKFVTGHIVEVGDVVEQMRLLGLQYGVTLYRKGNTIFALDEKQIAVLPRTEFIYTVKYLRGREKEDQQRLLDLVKPVMSPRGEARYEDKTGTLIIIDHEHAIEAAKSILERIDQPKRQVVVDVKILRIANQRANRLGFDWSNTLGQKGLNLAATASGRVNDIFTTTPIIGALQSLGLGGTGSGTGTGGTGTGTGTGTGSLPGGSTVVNGAGVVLDPVSVQVVLRALNEADLATQESGPAVITEDNEMATFRIIDRIPIIEQTVSQSNGVNNISTDVRYRIDKTDSTDPERSREIGVAVTVTPTILPDGTIRMKMYPRVTTLTGYVPVATGIDNIVNQVPQVNEASVQTLARIPNGYSLLLGGYYQTEERVKDSKVPFLGDLPFISFAFRSKQREKTRANVAFLLTPTTYDPASPYSTVAQTERLRQQQVRPKSADYPDDENPGENEKPRPSARARNIFPFFKPKPKPAPLSPESAAGESRIVTPQQMRQEDLQRQMRGR